MPTQTGQNGFNPMMNLQIHQSLGSTGFKIALLLLFLILFAAACTPETPTSTQTESVTQTQVLIETVSPFFTATTVPSPTPTIPALGSAGNPITMGFILTPDQIAAIEAAEDIAFILAEDTGYSIESAIYPDFQSLSIAVINDEVDLFWLTPLEYIYLNWEGAAQVVLLTNKLGVYSYGVQFMANIERGFTPYYDSERSESTAEAIQALQQFAGTRPCFLNDTSLPGYIVPLGLLSRTSTPTLDPVFTFDYSATIRALYIQGICDFGVTYANLGDPLSASDILDNIPTAQQDVVVIWQSEDIIPNLNLSASPELPLHIQHRLQEAILDLPNLPEGLTLLSNALGDDIRAMKTVQDEFYNALRLVIVPLDLDLEAITQAQNP
jgi:phosphonate transport system substrate-binding protein